MATAVQEITLSSSRVKAGVSIEELADRSCVAVSSRAFRSARCLMPKALRPGVCGLGRRPPLSRDAFDSLSRGRSPSKLSSSFWMVSPESIEYRGQSDYRSTST
jgi:hypothetical protein